jgi:crossover junction endodeoxyribonuclease RuvC
MKILGLDPGLATTGYGIIEFLPKNKKLEVINYGCIKTPANLTFPERIEIIYDQIEKLIKKYKPNRIAIEKIFFSKNVKTAFQVGECKGVIILSAIKHKIPIFEFTPLQVKQSLIGYGRASKNQIQKMVKKILNLTELPKPDDAADALAIALTSFYFQDPKINLWLK